MYRHEKSYENDEGIADSVSHFWIRNEVSEEEDMIHQHQVDNFSEDLHPIHEIALHRVEVKQVIVHDLNASKNCC